MMIKSDKKGFTLLEISIALVIIGLIVGAIVIGQSMVRSAELNKIHSQVQKLHDAVFVFKEKYGGLPGDILNGTSYWGADASCPNTPSNLIPKTATCDGDGDGYMHILGRELFRAVQQLANASLYSPSGPLSGTPIADGTASVTVGTNVPQITGNVGAMLVSNNPYANNSFLGVAPTAYDHTSGGIIMVGRASPVLSNNTNLTWTTGQFLNAQEMYSIDKKVDDGKPAHGMIQVWSPLWLVGCADVTDPVTAVYMVSTSFHEACSFYRLIEW